MDRLEYNILLQETGIYKKKEISKDEIEACDSELLYKTPDNKYYEIITNNLSADEIRIVLLAKQIRVQSSIGHAVGIIAFIFILFFILLIIAVILCW